jgi:hypothetical protein
MASVILPFRKRTRGLSIEDQEELLRENVSKKESEVLSRKRKLQIEVIEETLSCEGCHIKMSLKSLGMESRPTQVPFE